MTSEAFEMFFTYGISHLLCFSIENIEEESFFEIDFASMMKTPCYSGSLFDDVTKFTVSNCICGYKKYEYNKDDKVMNGLRFVCVFKMPQYGVAPQSFPAP